MTVTMTEDRHSVFMQWYEPLHERFTRYCASRCFGMESTEDIVQDAILSALELYAIMSRHSNRSVEEIRRDSDRDNWMRAPAALAYGLIDEVMGQ